MGLLHARRAQDGTADGDRHRRLLVGDAGRFSGSDPDGDRTVDDEPDLRVAASDSGQAAAATISRPRGRPRLRALASARHLAQSSARATRQRSPSSRQPSRPGSTDRASGHAHQYLTPCSHAFRDPYLSAPVTQTSSSTSPATAPSSSEGKATACCTCSYPMRQPGLAVIETGAGSDDDLLSTLRELLPEDDRWKHRHGSRGHGRSHVMPALVPPYATFPVLDGRLALGTWQSICLVDLNRDNHDREVRFSFLPAEAWRGANPVRMSAGPTRVEDVTKDPAVEAIDLVKHFGSTAAVDGVSFSVPQGSVLGLLGPNGAGKTTTVRMLTTLSVPTSGTGRVAGHDVIKEPEAVRRSMGLDRAGRDRRRAAHRPGEHPADREAVRSSALLHPRDHRRAPGPVLPR